MKKFFVLLIAAAFALTTIPSFAATTVTSEKIITTTTTTNVSTPNLMAQLKKLQATLAKTRAPKIRAALLKQINNLKARIKRNIAAEQALIKNQEAAVAAPTPPPPPVALVAPPAPVAVKAAPAASLFGLGINTRLQGGYTSTGKGSLGGSGLLRADWVMDDMVGLGSMVGLSANSVKYTLGLGVADGGGLRAIPVFAGGIIMLPADMMGGLNTFLSGGLNYVAYGNGKTTGKIGGSAHAGVTFDLGMGLGKTEVAVGYSAIRSNTVSSKGFQITVNQMLVL